MKFHVLFLISLLVSCSGGGKKEAASGNVDLGGLAKLQVRKDVELSADETRLIRNFNKNKRVDLYELNRVFLMSNLYAYAASEKNPEGSVFDIDNNKLTEDLTTQKDPHDFKVTYEANMERSSGDILKYNKSSVTIFDAIHQSRLQCYSGTSTFFAFRASATPKSFLNDNYVAIFTEGHVLPGYMRKTKKGEWNLYGIETTSAGKAKVDFGPTKDLKGNIRVVRASSFMLYEALKYKLVLTDKIIKKIVKSEVEETAAIYDIPQKLVDLDLGLQVASAVNPLAHNSAIFAFGHVDIPDQDMERKNNEMISPTKLLDRNHLLRDLLPSPSDTPQITPEIAIDEKIIIEPTVVRQVKSEVKLWSKDFALDFDDAEDLDRLKGLAPNALDITVSATSDSLYFEINKVTHINKTLFVNLGSFQLFPGLNDLIVYSSPTFKVLEWKKISQRDMESLDGRFDELIEVVIEPSQKNSMEQTAILGWRRETNSDTWRLITFDQ